jgi:hypothetical protein
LTVGGQTFGYDQQNDDRLLFTSLPTDLARHLGRQAIRATLEAVGEPYYGEAARHIAKAIEAHRSSGGLNGKART